MKKLLAFTLTCFVFLTCLFADGPSISLDKKAYSPGERIYVSYRDITNQMEINGASVRLDSDSSILLRRGSGEVVFYAPASEGTHEINLTAGENSSKLTFSVSDANALAEAKDFKISIPKAVYSPGEAIEVSYTGVSSRMVELGTEITLFRESDNMKIHSYRINSGSHYHVVNAPAEEGRYFFNVTNGSSSYAVSFSISSDCAVEEAKDFRMSTPEVSGGKVFIDYYGVTSELVRQGAFIGLSNANAGNSDILYRCYLNNGNGTAVFQLPAAGTYEARFYKSDSNTQYALVNSKTLVFRNAEFRKGPDSERASISIPKRNYAPGETITVSYSGVSEKLASSGAFVAISYSGSQGWSTISQKTLKAGEGTVSFTAPGNEGKLEIRLYTTDSVSEERLARNMSIPFTNYRRNALLDARNLSIRTDKTAYSHGETIEVFYDGVTEQLSVQGAFIAVSYSGNQGWSTYNTKKLSVGSGSMKFRAPSENGVYEIRLYYCNETNEQCLDRSRTIQLDINQKNAVKDARNLSISIPKRTYSSGETLTVSYSGVTPQLELQGVFIALSVTGNPAWSTVDTRNLNSESGTIQFRVPDYTGVMELRLYVADGADETRLLRDRSLQFTVYPFNATRSARNLSISLPEKSLFANTRLAVDYYGITDQLELQGAYVSFTRKGNPLWHHYDVRTLNTGSGTVIFTLPDETGEFELRFFNSNGYEEIDYEPSFTIPFTIKK